MLGQKLLAFPELKAAKAFIYQGGILIAWKPTAISL